LVAVLVGVLVGVSVLVGVGVSSIINEIWFVQTPDDCTYIIVVV
jgi:hypothetical protein